MNNVSTFGEALLRIAPADIFIPKRLGLYFPDKAAALGRLMAVSGQRTPLIVRQLTAAEKKISDRPWALVAGRHRLGGAEIENLPFVIALERIGGTAADALDEEASENLDRREQPPLEKAIFIFATCQAAKARLGENPNGQKLGARARWDRVRSGEIRAEQALQEETDDACDTMSQAYGWLESVAEAFGRDKRTIHRALLLYRLVIEPFPELTQALSDHPVVGNNAAQLKAIADIKDMSQRRKVIEALLSNPQLSADEARVAMGIDLAPAAATPVAHQKYFNQIEGGWQRLALPQRREFVDRIPAMLGSDDMKRRLRDRLNEELGE